MEEKTIKKDDVFFIGIDTLDSWGIVEDESWKENACDVVFALAADINPIKKDSFYIAVKYLGNGIMEEMTTGIKMIVDGYIEKDVFYEDGDNFAERAAGFPISYNEFLKEYNTDMNDYFSHINEFKKVSSEYPIILGDIGGYTEITEESKKEYLKHSDEERKEKLLLIQKNAILNVQEVHAELDKECEKALTITDETIAEAELDNNLYDFKNGKAK